MPRAGFSNTEKVFNPSVDASLIQGTPEQEAIWYELLEGGKHVIVEAVAGSGKTFTIVEYAKREKNASIGLVAFNKHIATELTNRIQGQRNVECMTYHSFGYRVVRENVRHKNVRVDQYKVYGILDQMSLGVAPNQEKMVKGRINALVSLAKTYGMYWDVTREELEIIADNHDIDLNGMADVVLAAVPNVLRKCSTELATVDFDDMVWLPMVLNMKVTKYDVLCVDEYQDTGTTQQWLAIQGGKRICAVGDPRQAIYQFRGADSKGFDRLREKLGDDVVTLPLTLTRRCPTAHVALAQRIVPQIRAMEDAPAGVVRMTNTMEEGLSQMRPGDLVLCRVNAELVGAAYQLIRRGVKAIVRGRDIANGMTSLLQAAVKREGSDEFPAAVMGMAGTITQENVAKFMAIPHGRGEARALAAQDKYDCLVNLAQDAKTVAEIQTRIEDLFADFESDGTPKSAVVLGTVHRTKGLEANRVFILRPDLIPHPMAKGAAGMESERNLGYVAVTRAKFERALPNGTRDLPGELIFVGGPCSMFPLDGPYHEEPPIEPIEEDILRAQYEVKHERLIEEPEPVADEPEWSL